MPPALGAGGIIIIIIVIIIISQYPILLSQDLMPCYEVQSNKSPIPIYPIFSGLKPVCQLEMEASE